MFRGTVDVTESGGDLSVTAPGNNKVLMYEYNAKVINIVDGDTIDAEVDLGFGVFSRQRFRLARVDTPELRSKNRAERSQAKVAKALSNNWLKKFDFIVIVRSKKVGKFGRWIAEITDPFDNSSLNDMLIEKGWPYGSRNKSKKVP